MTNRSHQPVDAVRVFSSALDVALRDSEEESGGVTAYQYADMDVVWKTYRAADYLSRSHLSSHEWRDALVRALWITGHGPVFNMTWPHIVELNDKLTRATLAKPGEADLDRDKRSEILRVHRIEELHDDLNRIWRECTTPEALRERIIREVFPKLRYEHFIALESVLNIHPARRLGLIGSHLNIQSHQGDLMEDLLKDARTWRWADGLAHHRSRATRSGEEGSTEHDDSAELERRTIIDAASLVSIVRLVRRAKDQAGVRFYSQSPTVRKFIRHMATQRIDPEDRAADAKDRAADVEDARLLMTSFRDGLYYILRACVPSISFDIERRKSDPDGYAALQRLRADTEAAIADARDGEQIGLTDRISDDLREKDVVKRVLSIVAAFSSVEFHKEIWLGDRGGFVSEIAKSMTEWRQFSDLVANERAWIKESLGQQHAEVIHSAHQLGRRIRLGRRLLSGIDEAKASLRYQDDRTAEDHASKLASDFGVMKWPLAIGLDPRDVARQLLRLLSASDDGGHARTSVRAALLDPSGIMDPIQRKTFMCVCWTLGLFEEVVSLARFEPGIPENPSSDDEYGLRMMVLAAEVMRKGAGDRVLRTLSDVVALARVGVSRPRVIALACAMFYALEHADPNLDDSVRRMAEGAVVRVVALCESTERPKDIRADRDPLLALALLLCVGRLPSEGDHLYELLVERTPPSSMEYFVLDAIIWAEFNKRVRVFFDGTRPKPGLDSAAFAAALESCREEIGYLKEGRNVLREEYQRSHMLELEKLRRLLESAVVP